MGIDDWNNDSILSRAGYRADGTISEIGRMICINHAISGRMENAMAVLRHLSWLIDDRGDRCPNALNIWQKDLGYVSRVINRGLPGDSDTVQYHVDMQLAGQANRRFDIFAGKISTVG